MIKLCDILDVWKRGGDVKTRELALGGMLCALAVVILLLGSVLEISLSEISIGAYNCPFYSFF